MSNAQLRKRQRRDDSANHDDDNHFSNNHQIITNKSSSQQKQPPYPKQTMETKKDKILNSKSQLAGSSFAYRLAVGVLQLIIALAMIYLAAPVIFRYSTFIQRSLLFMNFVNLPLFLNLSTPEVIGLRCTRTLQLQNNDITYGAWHILPESSIESKCFTTEANRTTTHDTDAFNDESTIIFYLHGNGGSRGGNHRNQLYKILAYEFNYHIITFDYRGYADSTNIRPSAGGLNDDAIFMYRWLIRQNHVEPTRIIVWGHSLGTAIATKMVSSLPDSIKPRKLILESPFDTIANAIANHPFSTPFRALPFFEYFFIDPIRSSEDLNLDSAKCIAKIKDVPILIMHAQDDVIIPYKLGVDLYKVAAKSLGESQVDFISADGSLGLGHKHMCQNGTIMQSVKKFIESPV